METKRTALPDRNISKRWAFQTREFGEVYVITDCYLNGKLSVALANKDGKLLTVLSSDRANYSHLLREGEFFAKTWLDNSKVAKDAMASGFFQDTGRTSGCFMNAKIWRFS